MSHATYKTSDRCSTCLSHCNIRAQTDRIKVLQFSHLYKTAIHFLHLYKYHVIDLYYRLDAEELINVTHSCTATKEGHCYDCMWCHERQWAFKQLNLVDPLLKTTSN